MDNFDEFGDDFSHMMDAMSEQVAHNTASLDHLLTRLQDRLSKDYTHIPLILGIALTVAGMALFIWRGAFAFSLTALISGGPIVSLTTYFRYRIAGHLTHFGDTLIKLDQDRQDHARKLTVIDKLVREGIPENMTIDHVLILLGEHHTQKNSEGLDNDTHPENN